MKHSQLFAGSPPCREIWLEGDGPVAFRLVEFARDGSRSVEVFTAPNPTEAVARAREVSEAHLFEVWQRNLLVERVRRADS